MGEYKLEVDNDHTVLWDGDQIGFLSHDDNGVKTLEMCTSNEDFENGEIPRRKRAEIRANLTRIEADLKQRGYRLVRNGE